MIAGRGHAEKWPRVVPMKVSEKPDPHIQDRVRCRRESEAQSRRGKRRPKADRRISPAPILVWQTLKRRLHSRRRRSIGV